MVEKQRRNVISEIKESENAYIEHLDILMKLFVDPLSYDGADFVSKNECKILFGEIRSIRLVNQVLCDHFSCGDIIGAFATLTPFLKLYSSYARNFPTSQHLLEGLLKCNKKFLTFLKSQEDRSDCKGLKLPALLIMPIQRIPRYKLLLEQLLRCTTDHQEISQLEEILNQINEVAELINSCIEDLDNSLKIISIQSCLDSCTPKLLMPGRKFIKEGMLKKETRRGHYRMQERMFWLFSDVLIYAKPHPRKKANFLCCCVLPLRHCFVDRPLGSNLFTISCRGERLLLSASNYGECDSWFRALSYGIQEAAITRQTLRKESSRRVPMHRSFLNNIKKRRSTITRKRNALSYNLKGPSDDSEECDCNPSTSWHRNPLQSAASKLGCLFQRKRPRIADDIFGFENNNEPGTKRFKLAPKNKTRLSTVTEEDSDLSFSEVQDVDEVFNCETERKPQNSPWWSKYEQSKRKDHWYDPLGNYCTIM